jgi:hypothetical protein
MSVKQKIIAGMVAGIFLIGLAGAFNFVSNHQITRNAPGGAGQEEKRTTQEEAMSPSLVTASSETVVEVKSRADAEKMLEETESSFNDLDSAFVE